MSLSPLVIYGMAVLPIALFRPMTVLFLSNDSSTFGLGWEKQNSLTFEVPDQVKFLLIITVIKRIKLSIKTGFTVKNRFFIIKSWSFWSVPRIMTWVGPTELPIKSNKSDWLRIQNKYFALLKISDMARGQDFLFWAKGSQPWANKNGCYWLPDRSYTC